MCPLIDKIRIGQSAENTITLPRKKISFNHTSLRFREDDWAADANSTNVAPYMVCILLRQASKHSRTERSVRGEYYPVRKETTMAVIDKEEIIARKGQNGRQIVCKNCMRDIDLQQIAHNEILLRGAIDDLYGKGKIMFCDSCDINIYRFISSAKQQETQESADITSAEVTIVDTV